MSVKLMSAIFETEFRDLTDAEGNTTKAATAKLVLLALADHANDDGEGAYPGLERMKIKTALTKQAVINTYDALKHNGVIFLAGTSKRGTNNYTINISSFPCMMGGKPGLLVNPVELEGKPSLPEGVNPVDPIHPLTIIQPSTKTHPKMSNNVIRERQLMEMVKERMISEIGIDPDLKDQKWERVVREITRREEKGERLETYAKWLRSGNEYNRPKPHQMAMNPRLILNTWAQAFPKQSADMSEPEPEYMEEMRKRAEKKHD